MAQIERIEVADKSVVRLAPDHVVGRSADSDMVIPRPSVSGRHAVFSWVGEGWRVRDLGSRNGTYLNGRLLQPAEWVEVVSGDEIAFAETDETWAVLDTHPPAPALIGSHDAQASPLVEQGGMFFADGEDVPPWIIYFSKGNWCIEYASGGCHPIDNEEPVEVNGQTYYVHLPSVCAATRDALNPLVETTLENAFLTLHVSSNEETAAVEVQVGRTRVTSGHKTHLYLLAYLARLRMVPGATDTDGWVQTGVVVRDLQLTCPMQLSVHVHRCRTELAFALSNPADVIDRSRRGMMRISVPPERLRVKRQSGGVRSRGQVVARC